MYTTSSIALSLPTSSNELITSRDPANGVDAFHEGHGPYQPRCQYPVNYQGRHFCTQ